MIFKQWERVVRYSLEDRMEDKWKEDIYFIINKIRYKDKKPLYQWIYFVNNEYWTESSKYYDPEFRPYLWEACRLLKKEELLNWIK